MNCSQRNATFPKQLNGHQNVKESQSSSSRLPENKTSHTCNYLRIRIRVHLAVILRANHSRVGTLESISISAISRVRNNISAGFKFNYEKGK